MLPSSFLALAALTAAFSSLLKHSPVMCAETCPVVTEIKVMVSNSQDASDDNCWASIISRSTQLTSSLPQCQTLAGALRAVQALQNHLVEAKNYSLGECILNVTILLSASRHDVVDAVLPCGVSMTIMSENYTTGEGTQSRRAVLDAGKKGRVLILSCNNSDSASPSGSYKLAGLTLQRGLLSVTSELSGGGGCMCARGNVLVSITDCEFVNCVVQGNGSELPRGGALHLETDAARYCSHVINIHRTRFIANQLQVTNGKVTSPYYHYRFLFLHGSAVYSKCQAQVAFENCTFSANQAKLIESRNKTLQDVHCAYGNDESVPHGVFLSGGALAVVCGDVLLVNSSFSDNYDVVCKPTPSGDVECGSDIAPSAMDLTMSGSSMLPNVYSHNSQLGYLTVASGSFQSWLPYGIFCHGFIRTEDVGPLQPHVLRVMSGFAEYISHKHLMVTKKLLWLGGRISVQSTIVLFGYTLALSYQPNTCQLEKVQQPNMENIQQLNLNSKSDKGAIIIYNYGSLVLDGTFIASVGSVHLVNYNSVLTRNMFELLELYFFNISNYGTITALAMFPLLKSFRQSQNGSLVVPADTTKKTCLGNRPFMLSPFSKLVTLDLNGTLKVIYSDTEAHVCDALHQYKGSFAMLRKGYTLVSPIPINIANLEPVSQISGVTLNLSITKNSLQPKPFWELHVLLKDVNCSAFSCSCEICHWINGCAWCTNSTNASFSPKNQGVCMPTTARSQCQAKYFNEETCCPSDCNGKGQCHMPDCSCKWTWTGAACTTVSGAAILVAVIGASIILTAVILVLGFAVRYQRKRQQISKLAKVQVDSLSQRLLDAEDTINKIKSEQAIPQSFIISVDELKLEEKIGSGGYGCVYRGVWRGSPVAVKQILGFHVEINDTQQFYQEAQIMSSLHHPNVVLLMGVSLAAPNMSIVMEYMPRGSVYHLLKDVTFALDWRLRISMALDAASGMAYLHSNKPPLVHRDLKTPNLLVDNKLTVKVADFGVSKILQRSRHQLPLHTAEDPYDALSHSFSLVKTSFLNDFAGDTDGQRQQPSRDWFLRRSTGCSIELLNTTCVGTVRWSAPELIAKDSILKECAKYNEKVDVYSFGLILWELASRSIPYPDFNFDYQIVQTVLAGKRPEIPQDCPSAYSRLMQLCWAHDAKKRPAFTTVVSDLKDMKLFFT